MDTSPIPCSRFAYAIELFNCNTHNNDNSSEVTLNVIQKSSMFVVIKSPYMTSY